jgi:hypothetical protein
MRDHVHLILTPAPLESLEKAMQFIKGGFSYRAKKEMNFNGEIWQKGYNEQRIKDADQYAKHVNYIWMNPVEAGLVERPEEYLYSSARLRNGNRSGAVSISSSIPRLKPILGARFSAGLKSSSPAEAGGSHPRPESLTV